MEVGEQDLENYKSGGNTLLQKACWCQKTDLVQALLDSGMNVNGLADDSKMTPILISASLGDTSTLGIFYKVYNCSHSSFEQKNLSIWSSRDVNSV